MAHIVFVDSTSTSLAAFESAKALGHHVTFIQARDVSTLRLAGTSQERIDQALRHVDQAIVIDELYRDLTGRMRRLHEAHPIDAALTTSEMAVLPTVRAAEALGIRTTPAAATEEAVTKDRCRDALHDAGLRSARHVRVETLDEARAAARSLGFPLVIKPSRGVAKEAAAIIRTDDELRGYFDALPAARQAMDRGLQGFLGTGLVMEEYVHGILHSAEVAAGGGEIAVMMITRRERASHNPLFEVAAIMPSGLTGGEEEDVRHYMQAVFTKLGLTVGVYHVEFIMTADGPVLVEVNARLMGGMSPFIYRHVTGMDPFRVLLREHLGERPELPRPPYGSAGIVVAFSSLDGGVAPEGVEDRLRALRDKYRPLAHSLDLVSGQRIARMAGNFSVFGYYCLEAADAGHARARGLELLADLQDAVELDLLAYATEPEPGTAAEWDAGSGPRPVPGSDPDPR